MTEERGASDTAGFAPWAFSEDASGNERRVGVELEFAGLSVTETSEILVELFGGRIEPAGHHQVRVLDTEIGSLKVELDSRFIKEQKHRGFFEALGIPSDEPVGEALDELIFRAASAFVPCEIVTAPLRFSELEALERLRARLHLEGAEGTAAEAWYAFGVHFNPALPSEEAGLLHAFLQAYCLLEDWIREESGINWSRRITPFVDPFPESYRDLVLTVGPCPSRSELIEAYLEHNPTRNRGLDMLPAFAHLEPELVERHTHDELVKARPAFHYRLADCRVDEPEWRIAHEWANWAEVERLAVDEARRVDLIRRGVRAEGYA